MNDLLKHFIALYKDSVSRLLFQIWSYLYNYDHSSGGRIWDPNLLKVDLLGSPDQIIHVCVTMLVSNISLNASFVYGENSLTKHEALWADIVSHNITWETIPWILLGDFNAI